MRAREPIDAVNNHVGAEDRPTCDGRCLREGDNHEAVCDRHSRKGEPVTEVAGESDHVGGRDEEYGEGNDVTRREKLQEHRYQWAAEAFPDGDPKAAN